MEVDVPQVSDPEDVHMADAGGRRGDGVDNEPGQGGAAPPRRASPTTGPRGRPPTPPLPRDAHRAPPTREPIPAPHFNPLAVPPVLPQRWSLLLTQPGAVTLHTTGGAAPAVPPSVTCVAAREHDAHVIVAPRGLLGDLHADSSDNEFTLPDALGLRSAIDATRAAHSERADTAGGDAPPRLLGANLEGRQASQLIDMLVEAALPCELVLLGAVQSTSSSMADPTSAALMAHSLWGKRVSRQPTHVVAMGAPVPWPVPNIPVQMVAAYFHFTGRPTRLANPPQVIVHGCPTPLQPLPTLSVLCTATANVEIRAALQDYENSIAHSGLTLEWTTTLFREGEEAAFHADDLEQLLLHSLQLRSLHAVDVVPDHSLRQLEARLRDLPDTPIPTSIWRPRDLESVVHIPLKRGAFPLAYAKASEIAIPLGGRVGCTAQGLLLMHMDDIAYPPFISSFREAVPGCMAARDDNALLAPARPFLIPISPGPSTLGASRSLLRLADPYGDRHLEWLVRTEGQASCSEVMAALMGALGDTAIAHCAMVNAQIPGTTRYTAMVRVRVVPTAAGAMAESFLGAPSLVVGSFTLDIFPPRTFAIHYETCQAPPAPAWPSWMPPRTQPCGTDYVTRSTHRCTRSPA